MRKNRYGTYNDRAVHDRLTGRVYVASKLTPFLNKLDRRVKELETERDRLREALEFAEQRSKQIGETSNDYYERLAEEFRATYGHLPPGKDDPLRTVDPDILQQEWEEFLSEPANARRAALQEDRDG